MLIMCAEILRSLKWMDFKMHSAIFNLVKYSQLPLMLMSPQLSYFKLKFMPFKESKETPYFM